MDEKMKEFAKIRKALHAVTGLSLARERQVTQLQEQRGKCLEKINELQKQIDGEKQNVIKIDKMIEDVIAEHLSLRAILDHHNVEFKPEPVEESKVISEQEVKIP